MIQIWIQMFAPARVARVVNTLMFPAHGRRRHEFRKPCRLGVEAERLSNVTDTYSEAEFVLLCGVAILFVRRGACGFVPSLHLARVGRVLDLVTKS